ncbi:hypothetical protein IPJ72_01175 [Candidatus Peregrinibacteria bacterium]|nr:MAG: hypothetical protein IPJ72_01175 [Candidatus Peregrinibacteria bacterium]
MKLSFPEDWQAYLPDDSLFAEQKGDEETGYATTRTLEDDEAILAKEREELATLVRRIIEERIRKALIRAFKDGRLHVTSDRRGGVRAWLNPVLTEHSQPQTLALEPVPEGAQRRVQHRVVTGGSYWT